MEHCCGNIREKENDKAGCADECATGRNTTGGPIPIIRDRDRSVPLAPTVPYFIGLGHQKGVGKDYVADLLVDGINQLGYVGVKCSFADALKSIAYDLFGLYGIRRKEEYEKAEYSVNKEEILPLLDMSTRDVWKKIGFGVREICPMYWVDKVLKYTPFPIGAIVVIPDVRHYNEAEAILSRGGRVYKVVRDDYEPPADNMDDLLLGYKGWSDIVYNNTFDGDPAVSDILYDLAIQGRI